MDNMTVAFLIRAKQATYAGKGAETASSRTGSHDLAYLEGDLAYYDTYLGGKEFAGEEALWVSDVPCWSMNYDTYLGGDKFVGEEALWISDVPYWSMNYAGRVIGDNFSGDFLKEALLRVPAGMPYRGPERYERGGYEYTCSVTGGDEWFQGKERICYQGREIYECFFHGGRIRQ